MMKKDNKQPKVPVTHIAGNVNAYYEQWANENGYIKLGEDEEVVKKTQNALTPLGEFCKLEENNFELFAQNGYVKLQPNQSVITWKEVDRLICQTKYRIDFNNCYIQKNDCYFTVEATPLIPQKREIGVHYWQDENGGIHIYNSTEPDIATVVSDRWKLIKTETITI